MEDVTWDDLKKYRERKAHIKVLKEDIKRNYTLSSPAPKDVLPGKSSVRSPSNPTHDRAMRILELRERLENLVAILEKQTEKIERFTLSIDDDLVAAAVRLRFLRGLKWPDVSRKIYGTDIYADSVRMAVYRYVKERQNDNEETDS